MNRFPNYKLATNAAYEVLRNYTGPYPQIDILRIISRFPNISIHTYTETAREFGMTLSDFLDTAMSDHGYTVYDVISKKGIIYFNDTKSERTIRFTLAHELGHIVLEHLKDDDIARREADCFARNVLCPVPLRDGFNLSTTEDFCECFNISEPMAEITLELNTSDNYYISKNNYNNVNDNIYCYFSGCTLAELYGY